MTLYNTEEIFFIFDAIKVHLNQILVKGIVNFSNENYREIQELKTKIEKLHLTTLYEKMNFFLKRIDQLLNKNITKELKNKLAIDTIELITIIRVLERVITLECINDNLFEGKN